MIIEKQNTFLKVSDLGINLEIKTDLLLNVLISETTKEILNKLLKEKFFQLKKDFEPIVFLIKDERKENKTSFLEYYKDNREKCIYEYASLTRDLYHLLSDTFEEFHNENEDLMEIIDSIWKYSTLYGFKSVETVNL